MNIHILTVVLGGLFGWAIGKLPDKYVFVILAAAICYALVTFLA